MRGKPITEEQAFEFIRRSDYFFDPYYWNVDRMDSDFCYPYSFGIKLIPNQNANWNFHSWIHIDGSVGGSGITNKYPDIKEYAEEVLTKLEKFPYLDFVIVITKWNEAPEDCWFKSWKDKKRDFESPEYDEEFFDVIELGIHVHDKTIQFLTKEETISLYKEYDALYDDEKKQYFREDFYDHKKPLSKEYVRKCAEANGFDGDEAVRRYEKHERDENEDLSDLLPQSMIDNLHIIPKCSLV